MDMQLAHGHAAWIWTYSMDMDMKYGHGHAAWTWMQHGHGHAAWTWALTWTKIIRLANEVDIIHQFQNQQPKRTNERPVFLQLTINRFYLNHGLLLIKNKILVI